MEHKAKGLVHFTRRLRWIGWWTIGVFRFSEQTIVNIYVGNGADVEGVLADIMAAEMGINQVTIMAAVVVELLI